MEREEWDVAQHFTGTKCAEVKTSKIDMKKLVSTMEIEITNLFEMKRPKLKLIKSYRKRPGFCWVAKCRLSMRSGTSRSTRVFGKRLSASFTGLTKRSRAFTFC